MKIIKIVIKIKVKDFEESFAIIIELQFLKKYH